MAATALNEDGPAGGEPQGPMVQVEVTDNGPGMPADVIDKIFSPFFTTKPQGSGLGLAIVRKIVDAHDGRIDVGVLETGGHAVPRHPAGDRQPSVVRIAVALSNGEERGSGAGRGAPVGSKDSGRPELSSKGASDRAGVRGSAPACKEW